MPVFLHLSAFFAHLLLCVCFHYNCFWRIGYTLYKRTYTAVLKAWTVMPVFCSYIWVHVLWCLYSVIFLYFVLQFAFVYVTVLCVRLTCIQLKATYLLTYLLTCCCPVPQISLQSTMRSVRRLYRTRIRDVDHCSQDIIDRALCVCKVLDCVLVSVKWRPF